MKEKVKMMHGLTPKQKVLAGMAVVLLVCLLVAVGIILTTATETDVGEGTNVEVSETKKGDLSVDKDIIVDDSSVKDWVDEEDEESVKPNKENTDISKHNSESTSNKDTAKPSTNTCDNSSGNTGGNTSTTPTKPSEPQKPAHTHSWEPVYKEVDNGYYEEVVVDQKAYTKCGGCGANISGQVSSHMKEHYLKGEYYNSYTAYEDIVEKEWVPVIEKELVGYKCSGCGATK